MVMKKTLGIASVTGVKAVTAIACLWLAPTQYLFAQSADVFQSISKADDSTVTGEKAESTPDVELLKTRPSRFAVGHVDLYVNARMADLFIRDKPVDMFGLYQDPDFKPVIKTTPTSIKKGPTHFAAVPLSEIVKGIKVSTIMIKEKSFLVGVRSFKEGDEFSITYQEGRTRRMKVTKVEPEEITFKDMDSGEAATLKIDVLPLGMSPGDDRLKPAGMVSPTESEPLILEIK